MSAPLSDPSSTPSPKPTNPLIHPPTPTHPTQKFRDIVECAPQLLGVLSADIEGRLLYANDAFGRVLHRVPGDLLGR